MLHAFKDYLCSDRLGVKTSGDPLERRTAFQHDYDRLVFSPTFRRLQNKTQVFPLPDVSIFVHNRLTHSLEVASVGRSLGAWVAEELLLRYPELHEVISVDKVSTVVSTASLAHDLGNPPFGHFGERTICAYFNEGNGAGLRDLVPDEQWQDFTHFDGNANTFRLLTHHFEGKPEGGFGLTFATLGSVIKYPYASSLAGDKPKFGFFSDDKRAFIEVAERCGMVRRPGKELSYSRHPFAYLVEAADDICYQIMDIEDAYKTHLVSYEEAIALYRPFLSDGVIDGINHRVLAEAITDRNTVVSIYRGKVIDRMAVACASVFLSRLDEIIEGKTVPSLISLVDPDMRESYERCSAFAQERIYNSRDNQRVSLKGYKILTNLLDKYIHAALHPEELYSEKLLSGVSLQFGLRKGTVGDRIQGVLDFLSGVTDSYASDLNDLLG